jgi:hypothetical protein
MVTLVAKFIGVSIDTMSNMITNFTNVYAVHALIKDEISRHTNSTIANPTAATCFGCTKQPSSGRTKQKNLKKSYS